MSAHEFIGGYLYEYLSDDFTLDSCNEVAADIVAALKDSGYAVVELPKPDDTGSGQDGEFDAWWDYQPAVNDDSTLRWHGNSVYVEGGAVWQNAGQSPSQARALAAALLAAADAAEADNA